MLCSSSRCVRQKSSSTQIDIIVTVVPEKWHRRCWTHSLFLLLTYLHKMLNWNNFFDWLIDLLTCWFIDWNIWLIMVLSRLDPWRVSQAKLITSDVVSSLHYWIDVLVCSCPCYVHLPTLTTVGFFMIFLTLSRPKVMESWRHAEDKIFNKLVDSCISVCHVIFGIANQCWFIFLLCWKIHVWRELP